MKDMLRVVGNLQLTRRRPVSLVHFVTRRCNARCPFCFIDFDAVDAFAGELTLEEIDALTRTVGPVLRNVNLTGGEPFARKEMLDIARLWLGNTSIQSIFVTSNGSLPDRVETFVRALRTEFPERTVVFSFSIDALGKDHDAIRRVEGLFDNALSSYRAVRAAGGMANIGITVSDANHEGVLDLYETLVGEHGVRAVTATAVRDEGVFRLTREKRAAVHAAYVALTGRIRRDRATGCLEGYEPATLQGRLMNAKNDIVYDAIGRTYLEPHYISPCRAASLFGVIDAEGTVYPCEVLDTPLGNLRDYGLDLGSLWDATVAAKARREILDDHCHCTYECAWTLNVLGNARYLPRMLSAAFRRRP